MTNISESSSLQQNLRRTTRLLFRLHGGVGRYNRSCRIWAKLIVGIQCLRKSGSDIGKYCGWNLDAVCFL
jgi:hypothetical protein